MEPGTRNERSLDKVSGEAAYSKCPDCGSEAVERANDEFYCKKCGLVLD